jgi:hypothetical protein
VLAAATDCLAELGAFELEPAASAEGRNDLGLHEQRPHQAGPKSHVRKQKLAAHVCFIGAEAIRV